MVSAPDECSRCTLVGLKLHRQRAGAADRRGSRCTLVGLKLFVHVVPALDSVEFQMHPRGVEASRWNQIETMNDQVPDAPSWG